MSNDQSLNIVLQAQDQASKTIASLQGEVDKLKNKVDNDLGKGLGSNVFSTFMNNASNAFTSVANGIENLARKAALLVAGGAFSGAYFVNLASDLQTAQMRMAALSGSTENANKIFGELYNYVLGKPIAFPDAAKAAQTLMGYGVAAGQVVDDMKILSKYTIVNGADMGQLALAFGQVQAKGKLMGQEVIQLTNNFIPVSQIIAKHFNVSIAEAQSLMEGGKVSAAEFTQAMSEFIPDSAIAQQANSFKNRMISLQGSIRSVGLAILGINIDPLNGMVIQSGGLFDKLSGALQGVTGWLKENKAQIVAVANTIMDNLVPAIAALAGAWAVMKIGAATTSLLSMVSGFVKLTASIRAGIPVMVAFSAAADANPFGLIALAIAAVVAAIVFLQVKFQLFTNLWNGFLQVMQPVIDMFNKYLLPVLQQIGAFIASVFVNAWNQLKAAWDQLMIALQPIMPLLQQLAQVILPILGVALLLPLAPIVLLVAAVIGIATAVAFVIGKIAEFAAWIIGIWNSISGTVGAIVSGFINRVVSIFAGMWNIASTVGSIIGNVIGTIAGLPARALGALGNIGALLVNSGKDLINGLINGINGAKDAVVNKIKDICSGALDAVKKFFGIKSPSRVMAEMGGFIGQGLANGIAATEATVSKAIDGISNVVTDGLNAGGNVTTSVSGGLTGAAVTAGSAATAGSTTTNATTNQFLGTINLNSKEAVDAFMARMGRQQELAEMGVAI